LEGMKKKPKKKKEDEEKDDEYYFCESCYFLYEKTEECCPKCGLINEKKKSTVKFSKGIAIKDTTTLEELLNGKPQPKQQGINSKLEELWQQEVQLQGHKYGRVWHLFKYYVLKDFENEKLNIASLNPKEYKIDKIEHASVEYLNKKYGLDLQWLGDIEIQIQKAWNTFYRLKKVNMKKNYKKSF